MAEFVIEINDLADLIPNKGKRRLRKRVGRGRGSGHGKTSTRGHNGQGQRSGESRRFGFEGGQTPLFRRLPKLHNFDEVQTRHWVEVNVGALNTLSAGAEVTPESLVTHRILKKVSDSLRILGNGELKVALKVRAHHFSKGAKAKIEAAGGTAEVIEPKPRNEGTRAPKPVKFKPYVRPPKKSETVKEEKEPAKEKGKGKEQAQQQQQKTQKPKTDQKGGGDKKKK